MTETYTGTRDTTIEENTWGGLHVSHWRAGGAVLGIEIVEDLREYFRDERDKELGRWRLPENPDHVVYVSSRSDICVFCESSGSWGQWHERELTQQEVDRDELAKTAAAYLAAHPEKKPWHDAEQNDVWALQIKNCYPPELYRFAQDTTCADSKVFRPVNDPARVFFEANSPLIASAEKVWPQSKES